MKKQLYKLETNRNQVKLAFYLLLNFRAMQESGGTRHSSLSIFHKKIGSVASGKKTVSPFKEKKVKKKILFKK